MGDEEMRCERERERESEKDRMTWTSVDAEIMT